MARCRVICFDLAFTVHSLKQPNNQTTEGTTSLGDSRLPNYPAHSQSVASCTAETLQGIIVKLKPHGASIEYRDGSPDPLTPAMTPPPSLTLLPPPRASHPAYPYPNPDRRAIENKALLRRRPLRRRRSYTNALRAEIIKYWKTPSVHDSITGKLRRPTLEEVERIKGVPKSNVQRWAAEEKKILASRPSDKKNRPGKEELARMKELKNPLRVERAQEMPSSPRSTVPCIDIPIQPPSTTTVASTSTSCTVPDSSETSDPPFEEERERANSPFDPPVVPAEDPLWDVVARDHVAGIVQTPQNSVFFLAK
ncbi:hypothetical protein FN846DRAFT_887426 [Sphaerosporella brunnea]|uniref:Uncharacterized protein n=1 Tax=Sphaerosporella brunnea TaxID=1250544 RepID=A0A5J5F633_9PEZI|nr:hypothetical protein FN846DRAFT_887426 [Sphaerosporella brunnea]